MTTRERVMASGVVGALAVAGGAFLVYSMYLKPLGEKGAAIRRLEDEVAQKRDEAAKSRSALPRLARWRLLSLPPDVDLARREYESYLTDLFRRNGFAAGKFSITPKPADSRSSPTVTGKKPVYTRLGYAVTAHGTLESLVQALEQFYDTGLMHKILTLSVRRPLTVTSADAAGELDIDLSVEALVVGGAAPRPHVLPNIDARLLVADGLVAAQGGPAGLALAIWAAGPSGPPGPGVLAEPPRQYTAIASKNIFLGPQVDERPATEVNVTRFVHLTDITHSERRREAFLYDRYNNRRTRLRSSAGFDRFRVTDDQGEPVVSGRVLRIEPRDVIFEANGKKYRLHIGQSIDEALQKPITSEEAKKLTQNP